MNWLDWLRDGLVDATEAELMTEIAAGRAQLWRGDTAAMVTQCVLRPDGRALHVWVAGGELAGVLELRPGIEAWGRAQGCEFATIHSRPGWARLLKPCGFRLIDGELRKDL